MIPQPLKNAETEYLNLLQDILVAGERKENRTGVDAITIPGAILTHDMALGFPLLTTKKMPFKLIKVELEFFIKGLTDKQWLKDRGCHIWDEWCSPAKVPYGHDEATKQKMKDENDLGPVYGNQWRHFRDPSNRADVNGEDQLGNIVDKLKTNPSDRRMICSAWNPLAIDDMALPPCHLLWQVTVINGKLNLFWYQRSCDTFLGIPFNVASYALLLHLLAKESGLKEGRLTGFLADTHIYVNHIEQVKEQLLRPRHKLPTIETANFTNIYDWEYTQTTLQNYTSEAKLTGEIAV
jgi:thymidylate synthase